MTVSEACAWYAIVAFGAMFWLAYDAHRARRQFDMADFACAAAWPLTLLAAAAMWLLALVLEHRRRRSWRKRLEEAGRR